MSDLVVVVRSILAGSPERWRSIARMDPVVLARQPERGEWSAIQVLQHVAATERLVFPPRVRACLAGEAFDPFDPDETAASEPPASNVSAADLAERVAVLRDESLTVLDGLSAADLGAIGIHPRFGQVTLGQLLHTWAAHDTMHLVQAERALMQPFIQGCGPWERYYSDHKR